MICVLKNLDYINSDYIEEDLKDYDVLKNKFTEFNGGDNTLYYLNRSIQTNTCTVCIHCLIEFQDILIFENGCVINVQSVVLMKLRHNIVLLNLIKWGKILSSWLNAVIECISS